MVPVEDRPSERMIAAALVKTLRDVMDNRMIVLTREGIYSQRSAAPHWSLLCVRRHPLLDRGCCDADCFRGPVTSDPKPSANRTVPDRDVHPGTAARRP
jgi:hypothetical protein